ncbi:hypothetical protein tb265_09520 [Gemmatimonadetes bacterium T265]|nr:hypothetical protein tb265_09520 [Gemmatimonadetes bacterium T265]
MPLSFLSCGPRTLRAAWRAITRVVSGALVVGLAACADQPTAPTTEAAPGALRRLVVSTPRQFTQVSAGFLHTCAVNPDGTVTCWGDNTYGQTTVPAGLTGVTQVDAGDYHTCVVTNAGGVVCWGAVGSDVNSGQTTVPTAAQSGVTQVSAGAYHTCAVTVAGTVICWGANDYGQTAVPAGLTGVTQVSAGTSATCAVTAAGGVSCWGYAIGVPADLPHLTQVSAGRLYACGVTTAGAAVCWGSVYANDYGEKIVPAAAQSGVTQVGAGYTHSCALTAAGGVVCWGNDNYGETDVPPAAQSGVTQLTVGAYHTCALTAGGTVSCWGYNGNFMGGGQLNVPVTTTHVAPSATFNAPSSATAGQAFTLALTGAQVPGHPEATAFTYAFDCGTGSYGAASSTPNASCPAAVAGTLAVRGKVIDQDGDSASYLARVTVGKAAQTITFTTAAPSPAYVGTFYAATAAATSGRPVTLSSRTPATCTVAAGATSPASVRFAAAGPCTLAADQGGDSTYAAAPTALQTVTVALRLQTITFTSTPPSPARVGGTYTVSAAVSSDYAPTYASLTPATCTVATAYVGAPTATVAFTAAGTCTVAADETASGAYAAAPEVTQTIPVVASFPATPVLDAFTRADGALGSNWGGFAAPRFFRVSQQHGAVGLGGGIGWAPAAFGTTQEAFVTLTSLGANGGAGAQGLVLKGQDPENQALGALTVTYAPQRGTVTVAAVHAPPAAGTAYPALAVRFAAGDQLGARATAAGVVTVYRNGALVGTVTLSASDQAYFAGRGGYIGLVDVAAPGALFDDFGGGTTTP